MPAHLFSFLWNVNPCGDKTGALPDGRKAWEPLAYSLSATAGRDRQGLTAFFNSLARLPHHRAASSSSAIIELSPAFFKGEGRAKFLQVLGKRGRSLYSGRLSAQPPRIKAPSPFPY